VTLCDLCGEKNIKHGERITNIRVHGEHG